MNYHYYNYLGELDGDCLMQLKKYTAFRRKDISEDEYSMYKNIPAPTYNQLLIFFHRKGLFITVTPRRFKDHIEWWWEITDLAGEYIDSMSTGKKDISIHFMKRWTVV